MPHKRGKYKPKPGKTERAALRAAAEARFTSRGMKQEKAAEALQHDAYGIENQAQMSDKDVSTGKQRRKTLSANASAPHTQHGGATAGLLTLLDDLVEWTGASCERMQEFHRRALELRHQARAAHCTEKKPSVVERKHETDDKVGSTLPVAGQKRRRGPH